MYLVTCVWLLITVFGHIYLVYLLIFVFREKDREREFCKCNPQHIYEERKRRERAKEERGKRKGWRDGEMEEASD